MVSYLFHKDRKGTHLNVGRERLLTEPCELVREIPLVRGRKTSEDNLRSALLRLESLKCMTGLAGCENDCGATAGDDGTDEVEMRKP